MSLVKGKDNNSFSYCEENMEKEELLDDFSDEITEEINRKTNQDDELHTEMDFAEYMTEPDTEEYVDETNLLFETEDSEDDFEDIEYTSDDFSREFESLGDLTQEDVNDMFEGCEFSKDDVTDDLFENLGEFHVTEDLVKIAKLETENSYLKKIGVTTGIALGVCAIATFIKGRK